MSPGQHGWLWWALLIGVAPGLAVWAWTRVEGGDYLTRNLLEGATPGLGIVFGVVSLALVGSIYWREDRKRGAEPRPMVMRGLNARLRFLVAFLVFPLLSVPSLEVRRGQLCLLLIVLTACLFVSSAYAWLRWLEEQRPGLHRRLQEALDRPRLASAVVVALVGMQSAWLVRLALIRHRALGTRIFDLGIFDNIVFNGLHGGFQVSTFLKGDTFTSAHFAPIVHLITPLYAAAPRAETLLIVQALWLASGAVPIYLIVRDRLERPWIAVAVALAYLLHPSVHGVTLFDFHALTLVGPLVAWTVLFAQRGAWRRYALLLGLVLLTREDTSFVAVCIGLYVWWGLGHRRAGLLTIGAAVAYLAVVKFGFMTHSDLFMPNTEESYRYANRFRGMIPDPETGGAPDLVATLMSNPGFVVQHVIRAPKMTYLAMLLTPILFVPVFQRRMWPLFGFGLAFTMLASGDTVYYAYLHYTLFLFPVFFVAAGEGIAGLSAFSSRLGADARTFAGALGVGILLTGILCGLKFGAIGESQAFQAGYVEGVKSSLTTEERERYAWLAQAVTKIPEQATVSASASMGAHVSNRLGVRAYRHHKDADYLLINRRDLGKDGRLELRRRERRGEYALVDEHEKLVLYRRAP